MTKLVSHPAGPRPRCVQIIKSGRERTAFQIACRTKFNLADADTVDLFVFDLARGSLTAIVYTLEGPRMSSKALVSVRVYRWIPPGFWTDGVNTSALKIGLVFSFIFMEGWCDETPGCALERCERLGKLPKVRPVC